MSDNQLSSSDRSDSRGLTAAARMNVIQLRRSRLVKLSLFTAAGLLFVYIVVRSSSTSTPHGKPKWDNISSPFAIRNKSFVLSF